MSMDNKIKTVDELICGMKSQIIETGKNKNPESQMPPVENTATETEEISM